MRRYGYPQSFSTGVIAAGGTLGAMLPPSTVLAVYGIITQQDIGKLFMAGVLPGHSRGVDVHADHRLIGVVRPDFLPAGPRRAWPRAGHGPARVWAPLLLFVFVIGGLYGGLFTPTEAGGMGAGGAFLIGVARGRLSRGHPASLLQATRTAAAVFTVLIGAHPVRLFPDHHADAAEDHRVSHRAGIGRYGVLVADHADVSGARLPDGRDGDDHPDRADHLSGDHGLGFDPIWFGVIIVMTVELGLIHPPVGMNVFVIKSVVKDVSFTTIFLGVLPFIADRPDAPRDPDRLSRHRHVFAQPDVASDVASDVATDVARATARNPFTLAEIPLP